MADLSFLVVAKNDLINLQATLSSLLGQDGDYEIVVKDADSQDGTVEYMESLADPRFKFISEPDSGIYDGMNRAVELASAQWVNFINCGDVLLPGAGQAIIEATKTTSAPIMKFLVEVAGTVSLERASVPYLTRRMLNHQGLVYQKSVLLRLPFDPKLQIAGDFKQIVEHDNWKLIEYSDIVICRYLGGGIAAQPSSYIKNWTERLSVWSWRGVSCYPRSAIFCIACLGAVYQFFRAHLKGR
jgi:glycosyltransferase involved in cell wall biosynthesis